MIDTKKQKTIFFGAAVLLIVTFYFLDLDEKLTLRGVQKNLSYLRSLYKASPVLLSGAFIGIYILITSLSIPGSIFLTLLSGSVFGVLQGTLFVTFAGTVGASFAFLLSRYLFRETIQRKFRHRILQINRKFKENGNIYLFMLRVIPASPYVIVNLLMGLTTIKIWNFFWVTFVGMLPGCFVYAFAGRKLLEIEQISEILTPQLLAVLVVIGFAPLLIKKLTRKHSIIN